MSKFSDSDQWWDEETYEYEGDALTYQVIAVKRARSFVTINKEDAAEGGAYEHIILLGRT